MTLKLLIQKSIALTIASAIVALAPGLAPYQAFAQRFTATGTPVILGTGHAPVQRGYGQRGRSTLGAGVRTSAGLVGMHGDVETQGLQSQGAAVTSVGSVDSVQAQQVEQRAAIVSELAAQTPDVVHVSETEAVSAGESDFYRKVGQAYNGYEVSPPSARWATSPAGGSKYSASNGASKSSKGKSSSRKMPPVTGHLDGDSDDDGHHNIPDPDGSINQRRQDDGPDTVSDEFNRGGGNSTLFSAALVVAAGAAALALLPGTAMAAVASIGTAAVIPQALIAGGIAWFGIILPSAVLHEYAHGLVAHILGDDTPKKEGRLTLNPFKHISLLHTVAIPMVLSLAGLPPVGMAKPMPINPKNFKRPDLGLALTAAVGPMVNLVIALAGVASFYGLMSMATPLGPMAAMVMMMVVRLNFVLAFWNLIPIPGSDGGNILRSVLPAKAKEVMDAAERHLQRSTMTRIAVTAAMMIGVLPYIGDFSGFLMDWMLGVGGGTDDGEIGMAMSVMPALAAASLWLSPLAASKVLAMPAKPFNVPAPTAASDSERAKILVRIPQPVKWKNDLHVDWVDWNQPDAYEKYQTSVLAMVAQLERAGIGASVLEEHGAWPTANFASLVRAAELSVPLGKKAALEAKLREMGFAVEDERTHTIVMPVDPDAAGKPASRNATLADVVKVTNADKVQDILKKELEKAAGLKPLTLRVLRWLGVLKAPVNPAGSIIDTGDDPDHPMLRGRYVRSDKDGHGHGTWVGSAVTSFDPHNKNLRSYATFRNGSATTGDILRDLTAANNEGAEWFTNSWGDSWGDPNSLESDAVRKIAEQGKVQFFAAGNQGDGDNSVGGPAIAYYRDPKTGTDMIVSVGATDIDGATAWFQSRGPWSPHVEQNQQKYPGYPNRVDIQSVGHNVYGAYPTYLRGPDRVDPELGPQKRSSGTSMSTPTLGGAYSLLREFGFEPAAIVKAMLDSVKQTGLPAKEGGRGFLDVFAAYQALKKAQDSGVTGAIRRLSAAMAERFVR